MAIKKLMITGGSGMVGRNIMEHPMAKLWHILCPSSKELDLTNDFAVAKYVGLNNPDIIIHAAGEVGGIHANIKHPVAFFEINVAIGRNIIMAAYKAGIQNFINIASTSMYPMDVEKTLREDTILSGKLDPSNEGYAIAKIMATRLCQYVMRENTNLNYKTIIPCNLYGRYDKFDPNKSHMLPAIIRRIHLAKINNDKSVKIWGDGLARREFMYAGDIADAVLRAANDLDALPELMNCGLGYDYTVQEYYEVVADVVGWDKEFVHDLTKPVGVQQRLCSIERQSDWGWSASTVLREGIKSTYDFYLNEAKL